MTAEATGDQMSLILATAAVRRMLGMFGILPSAV